MIAPTLVSSYNIYDPWIRGAISVKRVFDYMIIKKCEVCGKEFKTYLSVINRGKGKYCSKKCYSLSLIGKPSYWKGKERLDMIGNTNGFKKGMIPWNKGLKSWVKPWLGKHRDKKTKEKISIGRIGKYVDEKHPGWKGDDVKYDGLHRWINHKLGKPTKCEHCGKDGLTGKHIHWHNKNHQYERNLTDWMRLCSSCHTKANNILKSHRLLTINK